MLVGMDTLISFWPLVVALIPLGMALRALLTDEEPRTQSPATDFHVGDSNPSTFPSLATLTELENTVPTFVKRNSSPLTG